MPITFNTAQQVILDREWNLQRMIFNEKKPPKNRSIMLAIQLSEVGPEVSSQNVGKYYANRLAKEEGRPRAQTKTPEQISLLEEAFAEDMYPTTARSIVLVHETDLKKTQVSAWFGYQRDKIERDGGDLFSSNFSHGEGIQASGNTASPMWRKYKKDPEGYYQEMLEEVGRGTASED